MKDLDKKILAICDGNYPSEIARILGVSSQRVDYRLKKLKKSGLILYNSAVWPRSISLVQNPNSKKLTDGIRGGGKMLNLHKIEISLPIVSGDVGVLPADSVAVLRGWTAKYVYPEGLPDSSWIEGISSFRVSSKQISFFLDRLSLPRVPGEFERAYFTWVYEAVALVKAWLWAKYKIRTSWPVFSGTHGIRSQHLENSAGEFEGAIDPRARERLYTGGPAVGAFGCTGAREYAEVDRSRPGNPARLPNVEANSITYEAKLLEMPLTVHSLGEFFPEFGRKVELYTEQIRLHLEVEKMQHTNQVELNRLLLELKEVLKNGK